MKKAIINIIKFGVTAAILVYLYRNGMLDFSRVRTVLSQPSIFAGALLMLMIPTSISMFRWWLLLQGQNLSVSPLETFKLGMIGVFFNTAIPGAVSGDIVKGYYVVRQQSDGHGRIKAFTTLLIDRILGLSGLIIVSFASMLWNFEESLGSSTLRPLAGLITMLFLGTLVFYCIVLIKWPLLSKLPKLLRRLPAGEYFARVFESVKTYENCRHYVIKGLFISIVVHIFVVGTTVVLAKALGGFEAVPISKFYFLVPFGLLVTAIPIAPAGLGTGHAAFLGLFKLIGVNGGADLFTVYITFQILISLMGGLIYVKYRMPIPEIETT